MVKYRTRGVLWWQWTHNRHEYHDPSRYTAHSLRSVTLHLSCVTCTCILFTIHSMSGELRIRLRGRKRANVYVNAYVNTFPPSSIDCPGSL
jgi:hypothetical protein